MLLKIVLDWSETSTSSSSSSSSSREHELTLLSDGESAFYSGMCPGLIAGRYRSSQLALNLPKLCASKGFTFINASVTSIDANSNTLFYRANDSNGMIQSIEYDVLCVDIGSQSLGTSLPGVSEHAITTRPLSSLEAKLSAASETLVEGCRLVVVGGGAASVEMALALRTRFQHLQPSIELVTSSAVLLPEESVSCRAAVLRALQRRSVQLTTARRAISLQRHQTHLQLQLEPVAHTNTTTATSAIPQREPVEPVAHAAAAAAASTVSCEMVVWATGAEAHDVVAHFNGIALSRRGFVRVDRHLQSISSRGKVFAGGDCMEFEPRRLGLPKCGVYAVRAGPLLLHNVRVALGLLPPPLRSFEPQHEFLRLINCADGTAIGSKFGVAFEGAWVDAFKDWIDRSWMRRFSAGLDDAVELAEPLHTIPHPDRHIDPRDAARLLLRQHHHQHHNQDQDQDDDNFDAQSIVLTRMHEDVEYRDEVLQHFPSHPH